MNRSAMPLAVAHSAKSCEVNSEPLSKRIESVAAEQGSEVRRALGARTLARRGPQRPLQQQGFGCTLQCLAQRAMGALALTLRYKSGQWLDIR